LLAAAVRLPGAASLPLAPGEAAALPDLPARTLPLLAGILVVPWLAAALALRAGAAVGLAAGLLVALSPFAVHSSRVDDGTALAFLAATLAVAGLAGGWPDGALKRLRRGVVITALLGTAAYFAPAHGSAALPLLVGDVGIGVLGFALLAWQVTGPPPNGRLAALLATTAAASVAWAASRDGPGALVSGALAVACAATVLVAAAFVLGRLAHASADGRATLGLVAIALLPGLPSLIGEHQDGGRFPLPALALALADQRHPGEPLFATLPELVARELAVPARPLAEAIGPAATARTAAARRHEWIILLIDRGRPADGVALPPDLEASLELVAVAAPRRFDLRRHEARLYRRLVRE